LNRRFQSDAVLKAGRCLAITVLLIAGLMISTMFIPVSWLLAGLTVRNPLAKSEAIVLVGGGFKERAPAAAMLYRRGYAQLIILANDGVLSRWSDKHKRNLYQIEWAEENLVELGVPRDRIVKLPFYGSSTMFDALATKKYLLKNALKNIIVVSSDYHTRRTLWTFKHVLKDYSAEILVSSAKSSGNDVQRLGLEYVKLCYYLFRYGVFGMSPNLKEIPLKVR